MIAHNLNPKQLQAVESPIGPLLIVAGAGSGKTKTLTARLEHILASGMPAEHIIAITFTNKAADEMRSRISSNISTFSAEGGSASGGKYNGPWPFIGTFHSLGARILRKEAGHLGRTPGYTIYDSDDALQAVKRAIKALNFSTKEKVAPSLLRYCISKIKSELLTPRDVVDEQKLPLLEAIFEEYEKELARNNAFDFDDLILKPVRLWLQNAPLLQKYQNKLRCILVDEFQDVNATQYEFVRLLAKDHKNINVVGDDAQCVPSGTKILTTDGLKAIEKIAIGDRIISASGHGDVCESLVHNIYKRSYRGPLIKISNGSTTLRTTPNHIVFGRLQKMPASHYFVYLMYRKDRGFRIGIARGVRNASKNGKQGPQIGLLVRCNQEKADKMWIIKICETRADAEYHEYYFSSKYGIPTLVFDTSNRSMKLSQKYVNLLFEKIDTRSRAKKLMRDELLYFTYPHWIPQGTVRHQNRRLRVRVSFLDDKRKSHLHPWSMSRISVNTKDTTLKTAIDSLGFETRKGKLSDWRFEKVGLSYDAIDKIATQLASAHAEVELVKTACLVSGKRLFFQPASHLRPTMITVVHRNGKILETGVAHTKVEQYDGFVYDLDIENTHNYIANDFVVHNSIYGFRGADFRHFLNFERDWPETKVVLLEENYRSTSIILSAANSVISNNKLQKPKNLWTKNEKGNPVVIREHEDEVTEAEWIASEIVRQFQATNNLEPITNNKIEEEVISGTLPVISNSTAVLYRTNAQSRAIEQAFIERDIPYQIFGSIRFYERKEVKDIVACLRYAANPKDAVSLERMQKSLYVKPFRELMSELPEKGMALPPYELIVYCINTANYFEYLKKNYPNAEERVENLEELMAFAENYKNLHEFLEKVTLFQSSDNENSKRSNVNGQLSAVSLMTIHIAKGLEFDRVFVTGVNEGLIPHQMSYGTPEEIEEERRLMYVAMTRAKRELALSFYDIGSRFLYEISPELIEFSASNGKSSAFTDNEERYITFD